MFVSDEAVVAVGTPKSRVVSLFKPKLALRFPELPMKVPFGELPDKR
jgi:hypothetical protein